jgi:hypothetical protein
MEMNLLAQASELFLLLPESNQIHVRQIQSMQVATSCADADDQSDQDGRVSGPLGVGCHRGAVDEALLKIIQTLLDNITQLHLMNTSSAAHQFLPRSITALGIGKYRQALCGGFEGHYNSAIDR